MSNKDNARKINVIPVATVTGAGKVLTVAADGSVLYDSVTWVKIVGKPTEFPPATHNHDTLYEPIIVEKLSAFNKDFGTGMGDIARGNHTHDWSSIQNKPELYTTAETYSKSEVDLALAQFSYSLPVLYTVDFGDTTVADPTIDFVGNTYRANLIVKTSSSDSNPVTYRVSTRDSSEATPSWVHLYESTVGVQPTNQISFVGKFDQVRLSALSANTNIVSAYIYLEAVELKQFAAPR